jgi:peptidoglycan/LPS O-acetylase OafA/YrhL
MAGRQRQHSLDGLRAIAVLLVFAGHIDQQALAGGYVGVEIFFVLSGYLITYLLLAERQRTGGIALRRFYIRRGLRLFPALIVMVVAMTPIAFYDHIGRPPLDSIFAVTYLSDLWSNYSGNLSLTLHTWSLAVEEQFYLVWPAVMLWAIAHRWSLRRILVVSMLAAVVLTAIAFHIHRLSAPAFLPTDHVVELGAGALLAIAVQSGVPVWLGRCSALPVALMALVALLVAEVAMPERWWAITVGAVISAPIVAHLVAHRQSRLSAVFSWAPLVWLGERSYGFYLWHYGVLLLLDRSIDSDLMRALIGLPLVLVLCAVSFRWVERPFLEIKDRRFSSARAAPEAVPAGH